MIYNSKTVTDVRILLRRM